MAIRSAVEKITPAMATKILEEAKEVQNRNVSDGHVEWLASQMKSGKWALNGEAIIFDEEGQLIDGQHRLWAIVNSGVTIETLVTRGVERKGFATIDTGSARTSGNVLAIYGEKSGNVLSAALGWLHRYENGKMLWALKPSGFAAATAIALLKKHPGVRDSVEWAVGLRGNPVFRKVSGSILAFLRYVFAAHKPQKAAEFFDLLGDVVPDQAGTPTRVLRDWYLTKDKGRAAATTLELMAVTVKAWNAFLNGERPQKLIWRRAGKFPESFPLFPGETESKGKALKVVKKVAPK